MTSPVKLNLTIDRVVKQLIIEYRAIAVWPHPDK